MTISHASRPILFAMFLLTFGWSSQAFAATAFCDPARTPVQHTQDVLCANGTCNATKVTVTTAIGVNSGGCDFDLGGRDLEFQKAFDMNAAGFIKVTNAKNISVIGTAAKLRARGDFPAGPLVQAGLISLTTITCAAGADPATCGTILINGVGGSLDV